MSDIDHKTKKQLIQLLDEYEEDIEHWKTLASETRPLCPIWQCGGTLHTVEWNRGHDDDWQIPLLKCDNCHGLFQFLRYDLENKYPFYGEHK
jgi:hypothetical protein